MADGCATVGFQLPSPHPRRVGSAPHFPGRRTRQGERRARRVQAIPSSWKSADISTWDGPIEDVAREQNKSKRATPCCTVVVNSLSPLSAYYHDRRSPLDCTLSQLRSSSLNTKSIRAPKLSTRPPNGQQATKSSSFPTASQSSPTTSRRETTDRSHPSPPPTHQYPSRQIRNPHPIPTWRGECRPPAIGR